MNLRKIIFIVLIVVVMAIVGFLCWREFSVPQINHVADSASSLSANHLKVSRLYAAEIDRDAYEEALASITSLTEYTEEQRLAAAIAAGNPAFIPTFNIGVNKLGASEIEIAGFVDFDVAENQTERRFVMGDIGLEAVIAEGGDLVFTNVEIIRATSDDAPVTKIFLAEQAAFDITGALRFEINMQAQDITEDVSARVTLQFAYNVKVDALFGGTALEEQILRLHADITLRTSGILDVVFEVEPYFDMEGLNAAE
jgi:hypothetical protein